MTSAIATALQVAVVNAILGVDNALVIAAVSGAVGLRIVLGAGDD